MPKPPQNPIRQQKLAAKLKENLRRRKGQAKSRALMQQEASATKDLEVKDPKTIEE